MKISIHSLHWDNGVELYQQNKKVTDHFGLNVNYYNLNGFPHGRWMNEVLDSVNSDVIGFFDNDCVPTNREIVDRCALYALEHDSFISIAQASNHIPPCSHVFAAPAFFFITKSCYERLGKPSFSENPRADVAQEVSYVAEEKGIKYRVLYPTHYERPSTDGIWRLGNYGNYAIGTHFNGGVYHLYQGRYRQNIELFETRCSQIVDGTFSLDGMINSFDWVS